MAGLQNYIRDKPPDRQWLNPSNFLNQKRFLDAPAPVAAKGEALPSKAFTFGTPRWENPPPVPEAEQLEAARRFHETYKPGVS